MKKVSFAVMVLLDSSYAVKLQTKAPVKPLSLHWNEDPNSGPNPLVGKPYMTSTQAKYTRDKLTDYPREAVKDNHPFFFVPYNHDSVEPTAIMIQGEGPTDEVTVLWHVAPDYGENDDKVLPREADIANGKKKSGWTNPLGWHDDGTNDEHVVVQLNQKLNMGNKWHVAPDYGELDHNVVLREKDTANGEKFSGWTNPLGWTDDGADDEKVLAQMKTKLRYDESEGPTKADNGDSDYAVVERESDIANGKKFHGWTNPLGWHDDGSGDEAVLAQMRSKLRYDESEGPTKADNGEADQFVTWREADIKNGEKFHGWTNPLGWTDDGADDESVLTQLKSKLRYDESEGPTKADNGEWDQFVTWREADIKNGEKFHGWTNPLGWTDDGEGDEAVLPQLKSKIRYDESEGPTKADNGEADQFVTWREADIKNGEKFHGWTNPLGWTDDGADDESVLTQLKSKLRYDESEGPTKADNGEWDQFVTWREADIKNGEKFHGWTNPLGWTDSGEGDESVL